MTCVPTVSTLFLTESNPCRSAGATLGLTVPKRPTPTSPNFGVWLELQRGTRSHEQIARRLRDLLKPVGLKVPASAIVKLEDGRVPNWPTLAALAVVYDVPIEEMTQRLLSAMEFPGASDLLRHGRTGQIDSHHQGESDVPASDRQEIARLERKVAALEMRLAQTADIARKLVAIASISDEVLEAGRARAGGRRGHRKAG